MSDEGNAKKNRGWSPCPEGPHTHDPLDLLHPEVWAIGCMAVERAELPAGVTSATKSLADPSETLALIAVNLSPQRASAIYRTHVNPTATKRTRRSAA